MLLINTERNGCSQTHKHIHVRTGEQCSIAHKEITSRYVWKLIIIFLHTHTHTLSTNHLNEPQSEV